MKMFLRISMLRLKNFGILNLCIMATMKKTSKTMAKPKLKKAQTGGYNDTSGKKKLGPALGIGIPVTAMAAAAANMIKNAVKRRKERKATEEETKKALENAKSQRTKKSDLPAPFNKRKLERARRVVAKTGGTAKYKMGGAKKYQPGGPTTTPAPAATPAVKKPAFAPPTPEENKTLVSVYNQRNKTTLPDNTPMSPSSENFRTRSGAYNVYRTPNQPVTTTPIPAGKKGGTKMAKGGMSKTKFMTGGMVNSNAKVSALKKAGSKGVKPNINPKATAAKRATGRTGGTSTAPRTAKPKKTK